MVSQLLEAETALAFVRCRIFGRKKSDFTPASAGTRISLKML